MLLMLRKRNLRKICVLAIEQNNTLENIIMRLYRKFVPSFTAIDHQKLLKEYYESKYTLEII